MPPPSTLASPSLPPPTSTSPRTPMLASAIAVLVCLVLFALAFEGSAIGSVDSRLRGRDHAAASTHTASTADDARERNNSWMIQADDTVVVPPADLLHLSLLQDACLQHKDVGIPWVFGKPGNDQENARANDATLIRKDDPRLFERLRECPDVDVFLPAGIRSNGYCEDAVAYAKYLETRLLPHWVFDTPLVINATTNSTVMYHSLCPHTPVIMMNHYWEKLLEAPHWPKHKPVYLMPNVEMYELNEQFYWRADVVLCKTRICHDRLTKWYSQEGNPRNTRVFYTRHTTSDVAHYARHTLYGDNVGSHHKDFVNVTFIHTAGSSAQKGTRQIVECWLSRPDLPRLDILIKNDLYEWLMSDRIDLRPLIDAAANINVTNHSIAPRAFGQLIADASFFLCPSVMEGYGHYINQARASGGVVVTTNGAPMNELVPRDAGVLVRATHYSDPNCFLSGASTNALGLRGVDGMSAGFVSADVCNAVDQVVYNTTVWQREAMARRGQQQYYADTAFFARAMVALRAFANEQGGVHRKSR